MQSNTKAKVASSRTDIRGAPSRSSVARKPQPVTYPASSSSHRQQDVSQNLAGSNIGTVRPVSSSGLGHSQAALKKGQPKAAESTQLETQRPTDASAVIPESPRGLRRTSSEIIDRDSESGQVPLHRNQTVRNLGHSSSGTSGNGIGSSPSVGRAALRTANGTGLQRTSGAASVSSPALARINQRAGPAGLHASPAAGFPDDRQQPEVKALNTRTAPRKPVSSLGQKNAGDVSRASASTRSGAKTPVSSSTASGLRGGAKATTPRSAVGATTPRIATGATTPRGIPAARTTSRGAAPQSEPSSARGPRTTTPGTRPATCTKASIAAGGRMAASNSKSRAEVEAIPSPSESDDDCDLFLTPAPPPPQETKRPLFVPKLNLKPLATDSDQEAAPADGSAGSASATDRPKSSAVSTRSAPSFLATDRPSYSAQGSRSGDELAPRVVSKLRDSVADLPRTPDLPPRHPGVPDASPGSAAAGPGSTGGKKRLVRGASFTERLASPPEQMMSSPGYLPEDIDLDQFDQQHILRRRHADDEPLPAPSQQPSYVRNMDRSANTTPRGGSESPGIFPDSRPPSALAKRLATPSSETDSPVSGKLPALDLSGLRSSLDLSRSLAEGATDAERPAGQLNKGTSPLSIPELAPTSDGPFPILGSIGRPRSRTGPRADRMLLQSPTGSDDNHDLASPRSHSAQTQRRAGTAKPAASATLSQSDAAADAMLETVCRMRTDPNTCTNCMEAFPGSLELFNHLRTSQCKGRTRLVSPRVSVDDERTLRRSRSTESPAMPDQARPYPPLRSSSVAIGEGIASGSPADAPTAAADPVVSDEASEGPVPASDNETQGRELVGETVVTQNGPTLLSEDGPAAQQGQEAAPTHGGVQAEPSAAPVAAVTPETLAPSMVGPLADPSAGAAAPDNDQAAPELSDPSATDAAASGSTDEARLERSIIATDADPSGNDADDPATVSTVEAFANASAEEGTAHPLTTETAATGPVTVPEEESKAGSSDTADTAGSKTHRGLRPGQRQSPVAVRNTNSVSPKHKGGAAPTHCRFCKLPFIRLPDTAADDRRGVVVYRADEILGEAVITPTSSIQDLRVMIAQELVGSAAFTMYKKTAVPVQQVTPIPVTQNHRLAYEYFRSPHDFAIVREQ